MKKPACVAGFFMGRPDIAPVVISTGEKKPVRRPVLLTEVTNYLVVAAASAAWSAEV
jgi:hypothetical protein